MLYSEIIGVIALVIARNGVLGCHLLRCLSMALI